LIGASLIYGANARIKSEHRGRSLVRFVAALAPRASLGRHFGDHRVFWLQREVDILSRFADRLEIRKLARTDPAIEFMGLRDGGNIEGGRRRVDRRATARC
jgi:hypothetical protein